MRSKNLILCVLNLLLVGCSKMEILEDPTFRVTINVLSPLSVGEGAFTRSGSSLSDEISEIHYAFSKDNVLISSGVQRSSDNDFGSITLDLTAGSVSMFLFGVSTTNTGSFAFTPYGYVPTSEIQCKNQEFYSSNETIDITSNTTAITKTLTRSVAGLVFEITDNVPDNISKVVVSYPEIYRATGIALTPQTNDKYTLNKTMTMNGGKLDVLRTFVLPQTITSITVTAYDSSDKAILSKEITNLTVEANKRYTISGTLFESLDDRNFSISVDNSWGAEEEVIL